MSLNLNDDYSPTTQTPITPGEIDVDQADVKAALNARSAFYAIGVLSILGAIFLAFVAGMESPALLLGPAVAIGIFYFVCGYFAGKLHIWAFFAGLGVYALDTVFVIYGIANGGTRPYTLVVKAIILYFLVKGVFAALRVKEAVNASKL